MVVLHCFEFKSNDAQPRFVLFLKFSGRDLWLSSNFNNMFFPDLSSLLLLSQEEDVEKMCEKCGVGKAVHSVVFQVRHWI